MVDDQAADNVSYRRCDIANTHVQGCYEKHGLMAEVQHKFIVKCLENLPLILSIAHDSESGERDLQNEGVQVVIQPMLGLHAHFYPNKVDGYCQHLEVEPHVLALHLILFHILGQLLINLAYAYVHIIPYEYDVERSQF